eukprot:Nk52_evm56s153 gene=Nk52_evmTU56s153
MSSISQSKGLTRRAVGPITLSIAVVYALSFLCLYTEATTDKSFQLKKDLDIRPIFALFSNLTNSEDENNICAALSSEKEEIAEWTKASSRLEQEELLLESHKAKVLNEPELCKGGVPLALEQYTEKLYCSSRQLLSSLSGCMEKMTVIINAISSSPLSICESGPWEKSNVNVCYNDCTTKFKIIHQAIKDNQTELLTVKQEVVACNDKKNMKSTQMRDLSLKYFELLRTQGFLENQLNKIKSGITEAEAYSVSCTESKSFDEMKDLILRQLSAILSECNSELVNDKAKYREKDYILYNWENEADKQYQLYKTCLREVSEQRVTESETYGQWQTLKSFIDEVDKQQFVRDQQELLRQAGVRYMCDSPGVVKDFGKCKRCPGPRPEHHCRSYVFNNNAGCSFECVRCEEGYVRGGGSVCSECDDGFFPSSNNTCIRPNACGAIDLWDSDSGELNYKDGMCTSCPTGYYRDPRKPSHCSLKCRCGGNFNGLLLEGGLCDYRSGRCTYCEHYPGAIGKYDPKDDPHCLLACGPRKRLVQSSLGYGQYICVENENDMNVKEWRKAKLNWFHFTQNPRTTSVLLRSALEQGVSFRYFQVMCNGDVGLGLFTQTYISKVNTDPFRVKPWEPMVQIVLGGSGNKHTALRTSYEEQSESVVVKSGPLLLYNEWRTFKVVKEGSSISLFKDGEELPFLERSLSGDGIDGSELVFLAFNALSTEKQTWSSVLQNGQTIGEFFEAEGLEKKYLQCRHAHEDFLNRAVYRRTVKDAIVALLWGTWVGNVVTTQVYANNVPKGILGIQSILRNAFRACAILTRFLYERLEVGNVTSPLVFALHAQKDTEGNPLVGKECHPSEGFCYECPNGFYRDFKIPTQCKACTCNEIDKDIRDITLEERSGGSVCNQPGGECNCKPGYFRDYTNTGEGICSRCTCEVIKKEGDLGGDCDQVTGECKCAEGYMLTDDDPRQCTQVCYCGANGSEGGSCVTNQEKYLRECRVCQDGWASQKPSRTAATKEYSGEAISCKLHCGCYAQWQVDQNLDQKKLQFDNNTVESFLEVYDTSVPGRDPWSVKNPEVCDPSKGRDCGECDYNDPLRCSRCSRGSYKLEVTENEIKDPYYAKNLVASGELPFSRCVRYKIDRCVTFGPKGKSCEVCEKITVQEPNGKCENGEPVLEGISLSAPSVKVISGSKETEMCMLQDHFVKYCVSYKSDTSTPTKYICEKCEGKILGKEVQLLDKLNEQNKPTGSKVCDIVYDACKEYYDDKTNCKECNCVGSLSFDFLTFDPSKSTNWESSKYSPTFDLAVSRGDLSTKCVPKIAYCVEYSFNDPTQCMVCAPEGGTPLVSLPLTASYYENSSKVQVGSLTTTGDRGTFCKKETPGCVKYAYMYTGDKITCVACDSTRDLTDQTLDVLELNPSSGGVQTDTWKAVFESFRKKSDPNSVPNSDQNLICLPQIKDCLQYGKIDKESKESNPLKCVKCADNRVYVDEKNACLKEVENCAITTYGEKSSTCELCKKTFFLSTASSCKSCASVENDGKKAILNGYECETQIPGIWAHRAKKWRLSSPVDQRKNRGVWDIREIEVYEIAPGGGRKLNINRDFETSSSGYYPADMYSPDKAFDGRSSSMWGGRTDFSGNMYIEFGPRINVDYNKGEREREIEGTIALGKLVFEQSNGWWTQRFALQMSKDGITWDHLVWFILPNFYYYSQYWKWWWAPYAYRASNDLQASRKYYFYQVYCNNRMNEKGQEYGKVTWFVSLNDPGTLPVKRNCVCPYGKIQWDGNWYGNSYNYWPWFWFDRAPIGDYRCIQ